MLGVAACAQIHGRKKAVRRGHRTDAETDDAPSYMDEISLLFTVRVLLNPIKNVFFVLFCFGNTPLFHRQEHTQAHYQSISLTMTAFHLNVQFQGHVIVHAGSHE